MLSYILDFIAGLLIGIIAGLFGVGGGFLIVPTLLFLGLPVHRAIGTSLACITISSFSSTLIHIRKGAVLYRVVLLKEVFSVPFAVVGAYLSSILPERILKMTFGVLLILLAFQLINENKKDVGKSLGTVNYARVPLVGILAGLISGLLGISGGVLNVPLFHTFVGLPMTRAIGTSSLSLFFTALSGTIAHYRLGQVDIGTAFLLAPGLIIGGYLGAEMAHSIHPAKIRTGFAVILITVALKMLL